MSSKRTILLVDDEKDLIEPIGDRIEATTEYKVIMAFDGQEALDKLKKTKPDLIILDMHMPKMSGIEFYNRICDPGGVPKYPVMVLTASDNFKHLFKGLNVDSFMAKPFKLDKLLSEIEKVMSKRYGSNEGEKQ